jgi:hypothetical protein
MITKLLEMILTEARKHGVGFLVLLGMLWYFHGQTTKLEDKVDSCNSSMVESFRNQNALLLQAIERNSQAMENLSFYLKASHEND